MTGKLKTKGNMMLATKLDGVLKVIVTFKRRTSLSDLTQMQSVKTQAKI